MSENLWPKDFGEIALRTPVAILREQAKGLGRYAENIVVGRVVSETAGINKFRHWLNFYCSPLTYQMAFLFLDHDINLYPADIYLAGEDQNAIRVENAEEFTARLKEMLRGRKPRRSLPVSLPKASNSLPLVRTSKMQKVRLTQRIGKIPAPLFLRIVKGNYLRIGEVPSSNRPKPGHTQILRVHARYG